jgi:hypothetical protein
MLQTGLRGGMGGRRGILRLWLIVSAAWIVGLNCLLALIVLKYRSVLWGWIDLSDAIDWPKLVEANLVPPFVLGIVLAPIGLALARSRTQS